MAGLLVTVCLLVHTAAAQEATTSKLNTVANAATPATEKFLRIYSLKYANGQVLLPMLESVIPDARVTFDGANSRMIVMALPSEHKRLEEVIKEIDILSPQEDQLKVFRLVNTEAKSMLEVVSTIAGSEKVKLAIDPRTNSLLAAGPASELSIIEAILLRLDERSDGLQEKTFCVRIVWFAEGTAGGEQLKSDGELLAVQRELSKMGAEEIRPAGQTMVSVTSGGTFQISCSAMFGDESADLTIDGILDVQQFTPHLNIRISAQREQAVEDADADAGTTGRAQLVKLETEIVTPLDHYVVLGVTPAHEKTLAFAVQVRILD